MASQTFRLVMQSLPNPGKEIVLENNDLFFGRDPSCDVMISDAEVSRKHARVYLGPAGYILEDLGSTNGTFVNDQRLSGPHLLQPGETIKMGANVTLVYEATVFDPNATVMAAAPPVFEPTIAQTEPSGFAGQIPQGPVEPIITAETPAVKKSNRRTWLLAGCGCLLVVCCVLAVVGYVFDKNGLYCKAPFDILFGIFGFCG